MIKEANAVANIFEQYASDRAAEQRKIERAVCPSEDDARRTTLSLSLTVADKRALKLMAAERETTIAAIIHEWIAAHSEGVEG